MPQTLSLSNSCVNPFTEVKITNKHYKDDGRLMCFGEFICPDTGKYQPTIINSGNKKCELILHCAETGSVVHTHLPRRNQTEGYTKYRALMRDLNEQPIYAQELYHLYHKTSESQNNKSDEPVTEEKECELNQETVDISNKAPNRIGLSKTKLRHKYIDKLVSQSSYSTSDRSRYAKSLGDLVDFCIEHNINPYNNEN